MIREFVTYEQSLALKELGFDEPCFSYYSLNNIENKLFFDIDPDDGELTLLNQNQFYHNNLSEVGRMSAPLHQQAFKFFREKYGILSYIEASPNNTFDYVTVSDDFEEKDYDDGPFKTYEEAEQSCLNRLIKMVKTNNK